MNNEKIKGRFAPIIYYCTKAVLHGRGGYYPPETSNKLYLEKIPKIL